MYMAPKLVQKDSYDEFIDIWSASIIFAEMIGRNMNMTCIALWRI
jgi:hypothetical protein